MTQDKDGAPDPALRLDGCRVLVLFGGSELFGQERANIEVFAALAALGLKARFVISSRWGNPHLRPELERRGFEVTTAPFGFHWSRHLLGKHFRYFLLNLYGVALTSWRTWREAKRWSATHIYTPNWHHYSFAMPGLWLSRLPLVYRAGDELPTHTAIHRWLTRCVMKRTEQMVCISSFIRESCARDGMPRERLRVIYNYPPRRLPTATLAFPFTPPGAVVLTFVGQMSEHKGVMVLLDAFESLLQQGRNVALWLVGDSQFGAAFVSRCQRRVNEAGLGKRVVLWGYAQDVFPLLARTDVHVCPSLFAEPLSNVVGEAKLAGRPSVVFPVGGLPELVEHTVDGFICANTTAEALAEGISWFLDHPEQRWKAGAAARRSLEERFGAERFARQWASVFLDARGQCRRSGARRLAAEVRLVPENDRRAGPPIA